MAGALLLATHACAFAVCMPPHPRPAACMPYAPAGPGADAKPTYTLHFKRTGVPLGDAYAVTDYFAQGMSFGTACWLLDLVPPVDAANRPMRLKRPSIFVMVSRFRAMTALRLLTPLWATAAEKAKVVQAFYNASAMTDDLKAEVRRLHAAAEATKASTATWQVIGARILLTPSPPSIIL